MLPDNKYCILLKNIYLQSSGCKHYNNDIQYQVDSVSRSSESQTFVSPGIYFILLYFVHWSNS